MLVMEILFVVLAVLMVVDFVVMAMGVHFRDTTEDKEELGKKDVHL